MLLLVRPGRVEASLAVPEGIGYVDNKSGGGSGDPFGGISDWV